MTERAVTAESGVCRVADRAPVAGNKRKRVTSKYLRDKQLIYVYSSNHRADISCLKQTMNGNNNKEEACVQLTARDSIFYKASML